MLKEGKVTDEELLKVYDGVFLNREATFGQQLTLSEHTTSMRAVYERGRSDGARGDDCVLAAHSGLTVHREWRTASAWLYPGDSIVEQRAAPLASEAGHD